MPVKQAGSGAAVQYQAPDARPARQQAGNVVETGLADGLVQAARPDTFPDDIPAGDAQTQQPFAAGRVVAERRQRAVAGVGHQFPKMVERVAVISLAGQGFHAGETTQNDDPATAIHQSGQALQKLGLRHAK